MGFGMTWAGVSRVLSDQDKIDCVSCLVSFVVRFPFGLL